MVTGLVRLPEQKSNYLNKRGKKGKGTTKKQTDKLPESTARLLHLAPDLIKLHLQSGGVTRIEANDDGRADPAHAHQAQVVPNAAEPLHLQRPNAPSAQHPSIVHCIIVCFVFHFYFVFKTK